MTGYDMIAWIIDGVMLVLLALVLVSTLTLNSRLKSLRDSRREFEAMVGQFDAASRRADTGLKALQQAAGKSGDELQARLEKARILRDELSIMIESADSLARRLEAATPARGGAESPRPVESAPVAPPRSRAEQDLLRAIGNNKREGGA